MKENEVNPLTCTRSELEGSQRFEKIEGKYGGNGDHANKEALTVPGSGRSGGGLQE